MANIFQQQHWRHVIRRRHRLEALNLLVRVHRRSLCGADLLVPRTSDEPNDIKKEVP
jgi:hypothetical protein